MFLDTNSCVEFVATCAASTALLRLRPRRLRRRVTSGAPCGHRCCPSWRSNGLPALANCESKLSVSALMRSMDS